MAMPANYPEKWRQAAVTQYKDAAEAMEAGQLGRPSSNPSSHPSNPSRAPSHPQVPDTDRSLLPSRQDIEMANRAQVDQAQKGPPSATSEAASDGHGHPGELSKDRRPSGSPRLAPVKNYSGAQLSKYTDGMETGVLDDDSASACSIGDTPFAALANQPLSPLSGHSSPVSCLRVCRVGMISRRHGDVGVSAPPAFCGMPVAALTSQPLAPLLVQGHCQLLNAQVGILGSCTSAHFCRGANRKVCGTFTRPGVRLVWEVVHCKCSRGLLL